jgi:hypothetical protein
VIVEDSEGAEIVRHEGDEDLPEVPGRDRMWWNLEFIGLPDFKPPLKIRVVDTLNNLTADFRLELPTSALGTGADVEVPLEAETGLRER